MNCTKVKYGSEKNAQDYIDLKLKKKYRATAMGVYKCELCGAWHVTSVFAGTVTIQKYNEAVNRAKSYELKVSELKSLVNELKMATDGKSFEGTEYARLNSQIDKLKETVNAQKKTINDLIIRIARHESGQKSN
jgi:outer membrane murein-binding lipoprotein Lpp